MDKKLLNTFLEIVENSNNIVFFGGAGVSTESGIPDFRSKDGLYNQKYDYPPETILSHTFFVEHTEDFFKFYRDKMDCLEVMPNVTHKKLAELEQKGKLKAVVTQNIDGLHQKAGSKKVFELHGSVWRNYCTKCGRVHTAEYVFHEAKGIPKCQKNNCTGIVKPDVVLYEEMLNDEVVAGAVDSISHADTLIIGGTSLTVYPASGLINYFRGDNLVLINKDATPLDSRADLVINDTLSEVFSQL